MVRLILIGKRIYDKFSEDEMTVYAAQVSFFCDPFFCSLSDAASHSGPDDPGNFQGGFFRDRHGYCTG